MSWTRLSDRVLVDGCCEMDGCTCRCSPTSHAPRSRKPHVSRRILLPRVFHVQLELSTCSHLRDPPQNLSSMSHFEVGNPFSFSHACACRSCKTPCKIALCQGPLRLILQYRFKTDKKYDRTLNKSKINIQKKQSKLLGLLAYAHLSFRCSAAIVQGKINMYRRAR